jgi:hypothetical protein
MLHKRFTLCWHQNFQQFTTWSYKFEKGKALFKVALRRHLSIIVYMKSCIAIMLYISYNFMTYSTSYSHSGKLWIHGKLCVCVHIHTYIHTYMHTYIHTYTYIHTCMHACIIHTYIYTYTHTYNATLWCLFTRKNNHPQKTKKYIYWKRHGIFNKRFYNICCKRVFIQRVRIQSLE